MDLSRILNMVINIVLRRLISRGVDAGFGLVSGLGRRRRQDRAEGDPEMLDEAQHKASRLNPPRPPQA